MGHTDSSTLNMLRTTFEYDRPVLLLPQHLLALEQTPEGKSPTKLTRTAPLKFLVPARGFKAL